MDEETRLLRGARTHAGLTVAQLAERLGESAPGETRRTKGRVGRLLERALGVEAGTGGGPDFPRLGVELKTLPVDDRGRPLESTWVCHAPLEGPYPSAWSDSRVCHKLARVLWIPIVGSRRTPPAQRRVGTPLLWSPAADEEPTLRADWEELVELIRLGELGELTAHRGTWLQIRPKALDGDALQWVLDANGEWVRTGPRGFYLRARFTRHLLARHFALPG